LNDLPAAERKRDAVEADAARATIETWNRFAEQHGSFANQHSTL
jgi:hypothetical protein